MELHNREPNPDVSGVYDYFRGLFAKVLRIPDEQEELHEAEARPDTNE